MADSSFDIVSKIDHQEVNNALNQTGKEISTRFDFRGVGHPSAGPATTAWRSGPTARSAPRPCSTCSRTSWSGARCR